MSEKQVRKMKTRCYYTDYVNHAIRFFLSTPDGLKTEGKRKADIDNWVSVQAVYHKLSEEQKQVFVDVFKAHYRLPEGVRIYCQRTGADENRVWIMITKICSAIAKTRGLV